MKAGIIGYGRMGKAIERLWLQEKDNTCHIIKDSEALADLLSGDHAIDVFFEFTTPESAARNLEVLARNGAHVVCGTTGWLDDWESVCGSFDDSHGALFYASNFSVGMNIVFHLAQFTAQKLRAAEPLGLSIHEVHHTGKKDKPSGTAISLAEHILGEINQIDSWYLREEEEEKRGLPITAERRGDVKGEHQVSFETEMEEIVLTHKAKDRDVFAQGAIQAGHFLMNKSGVYGMKDLLNLNH